jgi:hypothetical protein
MATKGASSAGMGASCVGLTTETHRAARIDLSRMIRANSDPIPFPFDPLWAQMIERDTQHGEATDAVPVGSCGS